MKLPQLTYDASTNTLSKDEVVYKQLETGQIRHFYRGNGKFIIREAVLIGFLHNFLDGLDIDRKSVV